MTYPTTVNNQVTDAVTQSTVHVLGETPVIGISNQILSTCHAHSLMAYNAVAHQNQAHLGVLGAMTGLWGGSASSDTVHRMERVIEGHIKESEHHIAQQIKVLEGLIAGLKTKGYSS
jgi:hypothetical protein